MSCVIICIYHEHTAYRSCTVFYCHIYNLYFYLKNQEFMYSTRVPGYTLITLHKDLPSTCKLLNGQVHMSHVTPKLYNMSKSTLEVSPAKSSLN